MLLMHFQQFVVKLWLWLAKVNKRFIDICLEIKYVRIMSSVLKFDHVRFGLQKPVLHLLVLS